MNSYIIVYSLLVLVVGTKILYFILSTCTSSRDKDIIIYSLRLVVVGSLKSQ